MELKSILLQKKSVILKRWFDMVLETYPADSVSFFKNQKDKFANPVGAAIVEGIEKIFNELLAREMNPGTVGMFLDNIIRIRAVQDFTPAEALAFIFSLKKVVREEAWAEIQANGLTEELFAFESQIDDLSLISFNIYMKCREKIYEIKANEARDSTFRLLQRANLMTEIQEQGPDPEDVKLINIKRKEATK